MDDGPVSLDENVSLYRGQHTRMVTRPRASDVLLSFLKIFPVLALGTLACFAYFVAKDQANETQAHLEEDSRRLNLAAQLIGDELESAARDLILLSAAPEARALAEADTGPNRQTLSNLFLTMAQNQGKYHQLRYIDVSGMERVRVNVDSGEASVVPDQDLQSKRHRYYVASALAKKNYGVYLSPLDLNIENKELERPLRPMLRLARPVYDQTGERRGLIVLNYLANNFFEQLSAVYGPQHLSHISVFNSGGYWLFDGAEKREWGFIPELNGQGSTTLDAGLWKAITQQSFGQIKVKRTDYTVRTLKPIDLLEGYLRGAAAIEGYADRVVGGDEFWLVTASRTRPPLIESIIDQRYLFELTVLIVSLIILAVLTYGYANTKALALAVGRQNSLIVAGVDQSASAIIFTNAEGIIEFANQRFTDVTGYTLSEVQGQTPRVLKSGEMDDETYDALWAELKKGRSWSGELHNRKKDGDYYWAAARISPVFDSRNTITHFIGIQEDITEERELKNKLRRMASTDPLTGALNRRSFFDRAATESARAKRFKQDISILLLDLDRFKTINDAYGHEVGDQALLMVVEALKEKARTIDTIARFGGEEFVILAPKTSGENALVLAERFLETLRDCELHVPGNVVRVTGSVGVTQWRVEDEPVEQALKRADRALYEAKDAGRDCARLL